MSEILLLILLPLAVTVMDEMGKARKVQTILTHYYISSQMTEVPKAEGQPHFIEILNVKDRSKFVTVICEGTHMQQLSFNL